MVFDKEFKAVEANTFACQTLGYTRSELLKLSLTDILDPEELRKKPLLLDELYSGQIVNSERILLKKDKTSIPCEISSKILSNGNMLAIARDITEKKLIETKIKNSEKKFRTLFEKTNDAIFIMDNLKIIDCNPATEKLFNLSKSEIIGKTPVELSPPKQPDGRLSKEKAFNLVEKVYKGESQLFEWVNLKQDKPFYVEVNLTLFQLDDNPLIIAVIRDITERKKFEEELIAAKEKAEEMNRLKSSFLANMSHELRTPLVGILGYSEILSEEIKEPEYSKMVKDISHSGKRLMETLNSILDLSRIEANKFEIKPTRFNLVNLVEEEVELYKGIAQVKDIYLNIRMSRHELIVKSDKKILQTTITHLIN
ncbi:MAG: PAS domain S-box protein, partial [Ignavibacteriaceae bacterium]